VAEDAAAETTTPLHAAALFNPVVPSSHGDLAARRCRSTPDERGLRIDLRVESHPQRSYMEREFEILKTFISS